MDVLEMVDIYGEPYSTMLGIDLRRGDEAYVKWFLASILYAKPIREESATKTFKAFESHGLADARSIVDAGWDLLVKVLDEGGYARYDNSTANSLLAIFGDLLEEYGGSLQQLYEASRDSEDLERRLIGLGKGIGPVTVSIFLRDMRAVWPKAMPKSTARVKKAANALGIRDIGTFAQKHGLDAVRLETALHRRSRSMLKG
jgi:hypothetical protein